ncbi:APC family permease [Ignavigranum ruoffiae]|uniref:APC family permease n=1 Tax=Ignavigranum ruoffiae TaxID=89093 RepID=UPI003AFFD729
MFQRNKSSVAKKDRNLIAWYTLAFMCFSSQWSFGNIMNGFVYFNGLQVIFSWSLLFILYFIPYALMVGELGSTFKDLGGGVSSWIQETSTPLLAYYAGWTYWAVHVSYTASKGSGGLKALSWLVFRNAETYDNMPTIWVQLATLVVFLFFCWVASRGLKPLKQLTTLAGSSMFFMSLLFILMMFAAPNIRPDNSYLNLDFSWNNMIPAFDLKYLTSLSILVFAIGGVEKISPYVNNMKGDASKEFPKSMMLCALMVAISAFLGTIAIGLMFDPVEVNQNFDAYQANGSYWAFQKLGEYYGVGNLFMMIYAACNLIGQFSTLVLSIDAPLRMLLDDPVVSQYIPHGLLKKNKHGVYINGIYMVAILCGMIILSQVFVPGAATVMRQLTKLNSIMMPMRFLWVFVAYFLLKQSSKKFHAGFKFTKRKKLGMFFASLCFLITFIACLTGIYDPDPFQIFLNIITPFVMVSLGLILPAIRRKEDRMISTNK